MLLNFPVVFNFYVFKHTVLMKIGLLCDVLASSGYRLLIFYSSFAFYVLKRSERVLATRSVVSSLLCFNYLLFECDVLRSLYFLD